MAKSKKPTTLAERIADWRERPLLAYVIPFAVFMLFTMVPGWFQVDNSEKPWYIYAPEQWVYPIQTLVVGLLLFFFWKHYKFRPYKGVGLGMLLGAIGIVFWIVPSLLYYKLGVEDWPGREITIPLIMDKAPIWEVLFGLGERLEGFDPSFFRENTFWYWSAVIMRFIRMVIVVSLVEEIFWRGFLMRFIINPDKPFWKIPFGTHTPKAFIVSTLAFTIVHHHIDFFACLIYGSLTYWVCIRTKSLAACVAMHAVANLLLGLYTMKTEQWGFW